MILTYEAVGKQGERRRDRIEADSEREALELLRRRGLFVTRIDQQDEGDRAAKGHASVKAGSGRMSGAAMVLFTRQMAMLLRAGSAVVPALAAIRRQSRRPGHGVLLGEIVNDLEEGTSLTDSLRRHPESFDAVYCAVVAAGEASASLPQMFERLADIVAKRRAMRKRILGAMAYPCLLVGMCSKIILLLLFFVLPRFNEMFVQLGVEAPSMTRALLAFGYFLQTQWLILLLAAASVTSLMVWMVLSAAGRKWLANVQTEIPIIGRLRGRLIQAQVLRTMGMLLESRVGVLDSLQLIRRSTVNRRFQQLFNDMESSVTSGGQLAAAFERSGRVEPYICQAVRTGEDTGRIGEAISFCADILDETNSELVNTLTKLIEPVILIGMGLVVGGVAIALFLPLFDLTSAIK